MAITPRDFLTAAEDLEEGRCIAADEPRARTVIGRMYYAAFLEVREVIRGVTRNRAFDAHHEVLSKTLAGAADPDVADLGIRLDQLRLARNDSDYHPQRHVDRNRARLQMINARRILARARGLGHRFPSVPSR